MSVNRIAGKFTGKLRLMFSINFEYLLALFSSIVVYFYGCLGMMIGDLRFIVFGLGKYLCSNVVRREIQEHSEGELLGRFIRQAPPPWVLPHFADNVLK